MGDIWNPFDKDNPVYAKLAKETKQTRRRIRGGFLLVGLPALVLLYTQRKGIFKNMAGGPVNQFGVIRRK